jgi:hypothetical protein
MTPQQFKSTQHGEFVSVEGIGVMQVWKANGVKCLRSHGPMGYQYFEITDYSKVHLLQPAPPTGA